MSCDILGLRNEAVYRPENICPPLVGNIEVKRFLRRVRLRSPLAMDEMQREVLGVTENGRPIQLEIIRTTEGKTLRAEITLLRHDLVVEIPRTDTTNIPIQNAVDPADAELWLFSQHSLSPVQ